jgi:hypothetical protein
MTKLFSVLLAVGLSMTALVAQSQTEAMQAVITLRTAVGILMEAVPPVDGPNA